MKHKRRAILKAGWSVLRAGIERARQALAISNDQFSELAIHQWQAVEQQVAENFLHQRPSKQRKDGLWNDLKMETYSLGFRQDPYDQLHLIIDKDEPVFFFVNETLNEQVKFWYYQGRIQAIMAIIGETIGIDEYYLVSKKYKWFLSVNHHDILTGCGSIIPRIKGQEKVFQQTL